MKFKSEQFQWQEFSKCFVAEASELGLRPGALPTVVSINDNTFAFDTTDFDASHEDIAGWRFKPTLATLAKSATFSGVTLLIIND